MKRAIVFYFLLIAFQLSAKVIEVPCVTGDANQSIRDALALAAKEKGKSVTIKLQPAVYHFSRDEADKSLYFISNTTSEKEDADPTKHIALLLKGLKNITIDGQGATLMMTGEMTSFVIDECENITLKNLNIDYLEPTQTEMTIVKTLGKHIVAKVHPTSNYQIRDKALFWTGDGWSFSGGIAQAYCAKEDITWRTASPMTGLKRAVEIEADLLLLSYDKEPALKQGLTYQMRDGIRDEVCGFIHRSEAVNLEAVNFYFLGNFGVVCQYSTDISVLNSNFEPEVGSGRTNAGFADFIQVSGCKGLFEVKHCRFVGAHDDPINVHGTHLKIMEVVDEKTLKLRFMHHQSYGFDVFFKMDIVEFINENTLLSEAKNRVSKVEKLSDREILLHLEKKIPEQIRQSDKYVIENSTWTPDVCIENNYFSRIPTRGLLLSTRGKVEIRNNTFNKTKMSAILIANDARSWYESGMVKDVTISGNKFIQCGEPVILIHPENNENNGAVHEHIRITKNQFIMKKGVAVQAKSVKGLTIDHNTFFLNKELDEENCILTTQSINTVVRDNKSIVR